VLLLHDFHRRRRLVLEEEVVTSRAVARAVLATVVVVPVACLLFAYWVACMALVPTVAVSSLLWRAASRLRRRSS
jgi:hypothetical protein